MKYKTLEEYKDDINWTKNLYKKIQSWEIQVESRFTKIKIEVALWIRPELTEEESKRFRSNSLKSLKE